MVVSAGPLGAALVLAGVAVVLRFWSRRGASRPRHAGGGGAAARRLAASRWESYFREEQPTVELIGWPLVDPDRYPHLFVPAVPRPVAPSPVSAGADAGAAVGAASRPTTGTGGGDADERCGAAEHPDPVVMSRVLAGLRRLRIP